MNELEELKYSIIIELKFKLKDVLINKLDILENLKTKKKSELISAEKTNSFIKNIRIHQIKKDIKHIEKKEEYSKNSIPKFNRMIENIFNCNKNIIFMDIDLLDVPVKVRYISAFQKVFPYTDITTIFKFKNKITYKDIIKIINSRKN